MRFLIAFTLLLASGCAFHERTSNDMLAFAVADRCDPRGECNVGKRP